MRGLLRLLLLVAGAIWAWRFLVGRRAEPERATVAYADGSSLVLEPGSPGFERLAELARSALR